MDKKNATCGQKTFPVLHWTYDDTSQSNSEVKIENKNGYLVIPKTGDYFVYAQISFQSQLGENDTCAVEKHVTVVISKVLSGYPVPYELLRNSRFIHETELWNHAIYLGGIASLQKNDKVFVNVSNSKLVYNKSTVTFFGAFLI